MDRKGEARIVCKAMYLPSLVTQSVKSLPAMWETRVQSLGRDNSLEKEMTTHLLQYSRLENSLDRGAW